MLLAVVVKLAYLANLCSSLFFLHGSFFCCSVNLISYECLSHVDAYHSAYIVMLFQLKISLLPYITRSPQLLLVLTESDIFMV